MFPCTDFERYNIKCLLSVLNPRLAKINLLDSPHNKVMGQNLRKINFENLIKIYPICLINLIQINYINRVTIYALEED